MNSSEGNLGQTVRQGVARMRERLQAEQKLAEVAREYPEMAAREMLVFGGGTGPPAAAAPGDLRLLHQP